MSQSGDHEDAAAIAELRSAFYKQKEAFLKNPYPSADERKGNLMKLAGMIMQNRENVHKALVADFGSHSRSDSDLIEVLGVAGRAKYAIGHIDKWMASDKRESDPAFFGTDVAEMRPVPKGVVGNMVAWNFPFEIAIGPLVEMLAAGNRVIIKPSDLSPACGALIREMVHATFPEDLVYVSVGGVSLARAFPTLPWDHLLYTGNPTIGKVVMRAAAENLTPVTLELGGKCPAIFTPNAVTKENVQTVLGVKSIKSGQMCISVDYACVPRADVPKFIEFSQAYYSTVGNLSGSVDATGIISERHFERVSNLLAQAQKAGAKLVSLEGGDSKGDRAKRTLPLTLVVDPPQNLDIMKEEIFGPVLPIIPYDDVTTAVRDVQRGQRPLALYVFSDDIAAANDIIMRTPCGGACVNVAAAQGALPSLGFGGSGNSGMGKHHGIEGFREFSLHKGVVTRGVGGAFQAFFPPYAFGQAVADHAFAQAAQDAAAHAQAQK